MTAAGRDRVVVTVMLGPGQRDPAHPTGMTHLALNDLATALEAYGFELGGRPGDPAVIPYADARDTFNRDRPTQTTPTALPGDIDRI